MTLANGMFKVVTWGKETTWGTEPAAGTGTIIPRVQSTLSLTKTGFTSQAIRSDQQIADFRHGVRSAAGAVAGELQPKTWSQFFSSLLRGASITGTTFTLDATHTLAAASTSGSQGTLTVAGSGAPTWAGTMNFKVGDVIRLTGTAQNTALNLRILAFPSTTTATVDAGVGQVVTTMAAQTSGTITVVGKKIFTPQTGLTDDSYTIEHWHSDISQSEQFTGLKPSRAQISMPTTGLATVSLDFIGKDRITGVSQYFTTPAVNGDFGLLAGVSGSLSLGGTNVAIITQASISVDNGYQPTQSIGTNVTSSISPGIIKVSGQVQAYFQDGVIRGLFDVEQFVQLDIIMTVASAAGNPDFVKFFLPRVKLTGDSRDDKPGPIMMTLPFTAVVDTTGGTGLNTDKTTIVIQDSQSF